MRVRHLPIGAAALAALFAAAQPATAQDLYDTTVLRSFNFTFEDANWETLLRANYDAQINILADLEVEGEVYEDVGVRIRGNTSYRFLPNGSDKFSLNVEVDYVNPDQELMGIDALNLNNGWRDPTFCREVTYNNYVAQFIPSSRANHAVVTINGENWGVYINVQQVDKTMLANHFPDTDGLRIKCANNPNGPGLRYNGSSQSGYSGYEIKDDGGLADPWGSLIDVCNAVTNGTSSADIDQVFAIDPSIWSVVLENLLTDDDSYVNKGADFVTYTDPIDGRMFLLQTDANETFAEEHWSPTKNFGSANKPVLSHVLDDPEQRQRYMSHYRTVEENLNWDYFGPIFAAHRALIDAAVQADTKKLYSYTLFEDNFTETVVMPYSGLPGGPIIGLEEFVEEREIYLGTNNELSAVGPTIESVSISDASPDPSDAVVISAVVTAAGNPVGSVELFYRPSPTAPYERATMTDGGTGNYSAVLPIVASAGKRVSYYVGATSSNTYDSMSFSPDRTEWDPLHLEYTFGFDSGMKVTEWAYSVDSGEFVEFTNMGDENVDMAGWSFDDDHATSGEFDLSAFGIVAPGESVVLTEALAEDFRTAWGLGVEVNIIGELGVVSGNNLGRNDEIHLFDDVGDLVDRLDYGDQTYVGSIRTRDASGQVCCASVGQNDAFAWQLSELGDIFGSFAAVTGEPGTPGSYNTAACSGCETTSAPEASTDFWIAPSQPNPFSVSTEISFRVGSETNVQLAVFDATGREVRRLAQREYPAGDHSIQWDGTDDSGRTMPTGSYFAKLIVGTEFTTRKVVRIQ